MARTKAAGILHFNAAARIPAHVPLEEQVKVALALGKLRPGDLLPSIRQVEDELGVGRMLVRKAYQQLQDAGLVRLIHGRGAVVTGQARSNGRVTAKTETLIQRTLAEVRREGLDPVTFARMLHQRLMAEAGLHVPQVLAFHEADGFMLLSDLGRQTLIELLDAARPHDAFAWYNQATDVLLDWQKASRPGVLPRVAPPVVRPPVPTGPSTGPQLPATGPSALLPLAAVLVLGAGLAARRRRTT